MRDRSALLAAGARSAAFAVYAFACAAQAQTPGSVADYQLPPAPSPTAQVQGPIDPENPATVPRAPTPAPTATARPTPLPTATLPATEPATPATRPEARTSPRANPETAQPRVQRTSAPQPAAAPSPTPVPEATQTDTTSEPATTPATLPPAQVGQTEEPVQPFKFALLALGALGLIALIAGLLWLRRRRPENDEAASDEWAEASDSHVEPEPVPEPAPSPPARIEPTPPRAAQVPKPVFGRAKLALEFEPHALQFSLVYATLAYRLQLANKGSEGTGPLTISADLTAAHASRDRREQLAPAPGELAQMHELADLSPGETLVLEGQLRLPLEAIRPVRQGGAHLFMPLARFHIGASNFEQVHIFTFGEPPRQNGGALVPFRLEDGARHVRKLEARRIDTDRWLALDPVRRAG